MLKTFWSLFKKDCRMMLAGKFFLVALGSLLFYTLFINVGYLNMVSDETYNVYLYDPEKTQTKVSSSVHPVSSQEALQAALAEDANGVGIAVYDGQPHVLLYGTTEKTDHYRANYALSLLHTNVENEPEIVGHDSPDMKQRKEMTCDLLFIEMVAVGFLGIASVLFKEKQMGVIRVHAILPLRKSLFVLSKTTLFLLSDLVFAALMVLLNIGFSEAEHILPAILLQTTILSLMMTLVGFGCTLLFKDFKQFSLVYLMIVLFVLMPVLLATTTSVNMTWINYHPLYHVYRGLNHAFFGMAETSPLYYGCAGCVIVVLFCLVYVAFHHEMRKES